MPEAAILAYHLVAAAECVIAGYRRVHCGGGVISLASVIPDFNRVPGTDSVEPVLHILYLFRC